MTNKKEPFDFKYNLYEPMPTLHNDNGKWLADFSVSGSLQMSENILNKPDALSLAKFITDTLVGE